MKRTQRFSGAGAALLMMLFFVLCLTVLCALSLLSASSDLRLTEGYAASVRSYYEADAACARVLRALTEDGALLPSLEGEDAEFLGVRVVAQKENGAYLARYLCPAGENQALYAVVRLYGAGRYEVETWKLISTLEYSIDERIRVWQGEPEADKEE